MIELDLSPEIEHLLESEAIASGCSPAEFAAKLISAHVSSTSSAEVSESFEIKDAADARAWILSRNTHLPHAAPREIDWQQLKAEGRRY